MSVADDAASALIERLSEVLEVAGVRVSPRNRLDADRLRQGDGAVLTAKRAAELLPIANRDALVWLRSRGLITDLNGASLVVWRDVLEALRTDAARVAEHREEQGQRPRRPLVQLP